jgi:hypothetical protein
MAPLKVWQVQELSLQAAERIMSSPKEEALKVLTNIAQNFPLQVSKFINTNISDHCERDFNSECSSVRLTGCVMLIAYLLLVPVCGINWDKCMEFYIPASCILCDWTKL